MKPKNRELWENFFAPHIDSHARGLSLLPAMDAMPRKMSACMMEHAKHTGEILPELAVFDRSIYGRDSHIE